MSIESGDGFGLSLLSEHFFFDPYYHFYNVSRV
jgi:hypothetical protein